MMRTIYENYRGFKISKQENKYKAMNDEIMFSQWQLSEVLDTIDNYIEISLSAESQSVLPQN